MNYIVKKNKKKWDIDYYEYDLDGFTFHPNKNSKSNDLQITSIKIFNEEMIENLVHNKISDKFKLLYNKIMQTLYDEDSSDDANEVVLGEIQKFRSALDIRYKNFMKNEEYKIYIENLYYLDIELRNKIAINNYRKQMMMNNMLDQYNFSFDEDIEELEDTYSHARSR
jgi:hypothetical protein